ncbi:MAG: M48 family metallopeptidase [bacterium]|nr:M48 family metallopeptidase [bacterium]
MLRMLDLATRSARQWTARIVYRTAPAVFLASFALTGCANTNLFSLDQDAQMGAEAYTQILEGQNVIRSGPEVQMAERVTSRLVEAARHFEPELVEAFEWEVTVIDDANTVNAFALPGGKMAVYTGIIPVAGGEEGLAVVMGHEITHVLERHGTEAMTRQYGMETLIQIVVGADYQQIAQLAGNLLALRYGRGAELQADDLGLLIMARAGYDPRAAPEFWRRMSSGGGEAPPEWLSTHPSHETRISQLEAQLPKAMKIYEKHRR